MPASREFRRPREAKPAPARPMELEIAAVGAQGDGVAPGPVFVPFTLGGERVTADVAGDRGELTAVLRASSDRVAPPCPHFGDCGGCAVQHWAHPPYLAWKAEQVASALARVGLEAEILPTFASPPGSRRRVALHARKEGGQVRLGFKARRSWRTVDIAVCPITHPGLVEALPALRELARPLFEHPKSAPILHATLTDDGIDVDITGVEAKSGGLSADRRIQLAEAAQAGGFPRVTLAGEAAYQVLTPSVRLGRATVGLPPGAFLQAVPQAQAAMTAFAAEAVDGAGRIADLFCGVGTFTFALAEIAPVLAADGSALAVAALRTATATAPGLKGIVAEARDLARRPVLAAELKRVDAVVFDPPRIGAVEQTREIAASGASRVVAVSCNPGTFARDARTLVDAGFRLEQVLPVDQFLWSPHVELVAAFSR